MLTPFKVGLSVFVLQGHSFSSAGLFFHHRLMSLLLLPSSHSLFLASLHLQLRKMRVKPRTTLGQPFLSFSSSSSQRANRSVGWRIPAEVRWASVIDRPNFPSNCSHSTSSGQFPTLTFHQGSCSGEFLCLLLEPH